VRPLTPPPQLFREGTPIADTGFVATCVDADAARSRTARVWLAPDVDAVRDDVITSALILIRVVRLAKRAQALEDDVAARFR
jgi:predicted nucleic acid-binding protein